MGVRARHRYMVLSKGVKYDKLYQLIHADEIAEREENNDAGRETTRAAAADAAGLGASVKALESKVDTMGERFNSLEYKLDELLKRTAGKVTLQRGPAGPSTRLGARPQGSGVPNLRPTTQYRSPAAVQYSAPAPSVAVQMSPPRPAAAPPPAPASSLRSVGLVGPDTPVSPDRTPPGADPRLRA